jgi:hypothetical protein
MFQPAAKPPTMVDTNNYYTPSGSKRISLSGDDRAHIAN